MNIDQRFSRIKSLIVTLVFTFIAALLVLIIIFKVDIFRIHGTSMNPTLYNGNVVVSYKAKKYNRGDIISFHQNDANMIKRIIGLPGDEINIDEEGNVYVNKKQIEEKYILSKDPGDIEVAMPLIVPSNHYFVLGDNRADSIDSRLIKIGCIKEENIEGKVFISLIPLKKLS